MDEEVKQIPLRQFQLTEVKLLKKVLRFFEENNISYYALGGTLLGAVRHKGFIPWDDDIDIGVPREDYERLLNLCEKGATNLEFHTFRNDKEHIYYFSRFVDPSVKVKIVNRLETEICPAWIDIFPLDGMPNNFVIRLIWKIHLLWLRARCQLSVFSTNVKINKLRRPIYERLLIKFCYIFPVEKIFSKLREYERFDRALKRFPYAKSNYLVNAMGAWKFKEMFHKKYYGDGSLYAFEDLMIRGPVDYDFVLKQLYGDYMSPPPIDEKDHHGVSMVYSSTGTEDDDKYMRGRRKYREALIRGSLTAGKAVAA